MLASQSSPDLMSYLVSKTQDKPFWGTPGLNIWPAYVHVHERPHSPWVSTNVYGHTQRHIHTGSYCKWKIRILILSWHHYFQESVCDCKYQVSLLGISNISKMLLILKPREVMASRQRCQQCDHSVPVSLGSSWAFAIYGGVFSAVLCSCLPVFQCRLLSLLGGPCDINLSFLYFLLFQQICLVIKHVLLHSLHKLGKLYYTSFVSICTVDPTYRFHHSEQLEPDIISSYIF